MRDSGIRDHANAWTRSRRISTTIGIGPLRGDDSLVIFHVIQRRLQRFSKRVLAASRCQSKPSERAFDASSGNLCAVFLHGIFSLDEKAQDCHLDFADRNHLAGRLIPIHSATVAWRAGFGCRARAVMGSHRNARFLFQILVWRRVGR